MTVGMQVEMVMVLKRGAELTAGDEGAEVGTPPAAEVVTGGAGTEVG